MVARKKAPAGWQGLVRLQTCKHVHAFPVQNQFQPMMTVRPIYLHGVIAGILEKYSWLLESVGSGMINFIPVISEKKKFDDRFPGI